MNTMDCELIQASGKEENDEESRAARRQQAAQSREENQTEDTIQTETHARDGQQGTLRGLRDGEHGLNTRQD